MPDTAPIAWGLDDILDAMLEFDPEAVVKTTVDIGRCVAGEVLGCPRRIKVYVYFEAVFVSFVFLDGRPRLFADPIEAIQYAIHLKRQHQQREDAP